MTWNAVNSSLTSVVVDKGNEGKKTYTYSYFSDGQRLSKKVDGKTTTYIYNAGMLLAEETDTDRINYYYDADGIITEIGYQIKDGQKFGKETYYFFTRNGQGDIVGVYRSGSSTIVGTYEYDLWGNVVSVNQKTVKVGKTTYTDTQNIMNRNPLRYRGYYYDNETGFYYLNARYYDPKVHRFINADSVIAGVSDDVTGYNLFAYCDNDPDLLVPVTNFRVMMKNSNIITIGIILENKQENSMKSLWNMRFYKQA